MDASKNNHKYIHILKFEIWCCRSTEKSNFTIPVGNEEVLLGVKVERYILHSIKRRNVNWIGHNLRRNGLLKHLIEEKVEGTGSEGRRCKQLLKDREEKRRCWKVAEALYGPLRRSRFGKGCRPVVRKTT